MRPTVAIFLAASVAAACSCGPFASAPLCQRIDAVQVLFIGTVVEAHGTDDGFIRAGIWYRVTVDEVFKGLDSHVREVIVDPASGTSCQDRFSVGKRYLVSSYGSTLAAQQAAAITILPTRPEGGKPRPPGPVVVTGACSGSREIENAKDAVEFARQYLREPKPATIMGSVRSHADEFLWDEDYPPLAGTRIKVAGADGVAIRTTDRAGRFEIGDVIPGKYRISATLAGYSSRQPYYEIMVPTHGRGVARIAMVTDARLSGRVLHADGGPARRLPVEVLLADNRYRAPYRPERSTKTDEQGRFDLRGLPAGEFFLGVRIDSAPEAEEGIRPTYWPGQTDRNKAERVHLLPNEQKQDLVIQLGPRAANRTVTVRVQWPDGRPAAETRVTASTNGFIAESGETGADGAVQIVLLEGAKYDLKARAWTRYRTSPTGFRLGDEWVDSERATLPASSGPAEVRLVLNKPEPKR